MSSPQQSAPDALAILRSLKAVHDSWGAPPESQMVLSRQEIDTISAAIEARDAQIKAMCEVISDLSNMLELKSADAGAVLLRVLDIAALVERAKLVSAVLEQVELWTMAAGPGIDDQLLAAWGALAAWDAKAAEGGGT